MKKNIISIILVALLSSCSYFHIQKLPVTQGNIIERAEVSQLHTGMSESDVRQVMGNPVLVNLFTPSRIEYVYTYKRGVDPRVEKRVSCIFEGGRLVRIDKQLSTSSEKLSAA